MNVKTPSIKKRCDKCKIISRSKKGKSFNTKKPRLFVRCENRRHNQSQG